MERARKHQQAGKARETSRSGETWPLGHGPRLSDLPPRQMLALLLKRDAYGSPAESLTVDQLPAPELSAADAGSVLVAVLATGPNFNTNFAALGLPVPVFGRADPAELHIPGSDAVGIVIDAGPAVHGLRLGQAVMLDSWTGSSIRGYETHDGFNAQLVRVPEEQALPLPEELRSLPPERLGALLLTQGTAYRAVIERLALETGESLLVMGGGKGTSFAAVQLAASVGGRAILMGSDPELMGQLVERGLAHAFIDRRTLPAELFGPLEPEDDLQAWQERTEAFREAIRRANGGRLVDAVFEHTGARNFPLLVSALRPGGRLAFFGATGSGVKGEYRHTFAYQGHRLVFDARYVWMRQKQLLFRPENPAQILTEIGLPPGRRVLVWGADAYARGFAEAALQRSAAVAVIASRQTEGEGLAALLELGVPEEAILERGRFSLPADMPDPLLPEGKPNPEYDSGFLRPARALGRALWQLWGRGVSPDVIVERPQSSTYHLSAFLARDFDERDQFPAGHVIVRGEETLSLRGSHMYSRPMAREVVRLLAKGTLQVTEADLEVVSLEEMPELQEKMLRGGMRKPKGVALVQAAREGIPLRDYEADFRGRPFWTSDTQAGRYLSVSLLDDIALVSIERPAALNALNEQLLANLEELTQELTDGELAGKVGGLVLTGSGRAFMAGADIEIFHGRSEAELAGLAQRVNRSFRALERLAVPVVVLVNGLTLGGGNELAMSGHHRISVPQALFGQPEVKLGIFPLFGGTQRLPRLAGPRAAALLCANGEPIDADHALRLGLVDEIHPPATALRRAWQAARELSAGPPEAWRPDWEARERRFAGELEEVMNEPAVRGLRAAPVVTSLEDAQDREQVRRAAAGQALEAMREGFALGFEAGLEADARRFGRLGASRGAQEWIGRFLQKDPEQAGSVRLLPG